MGEGIELESKRERIKMALSDVEWGPEEEREDLKYIVESMPGSIEDSLKIMEACKEVEILDFKVGNGAIVVKFRCDGEVYTGKWRYEKLCVYTVRFSKLE